MHVPMHACMYACMCMCMYMCMCTCVYVHVHVYVYVCVYIYIYVIITMIGIAAHAVQFCLAWPLHLKQWNAKERDLKMT